MRYRTLHLCVSALTSSLRLFVFVIGAHSDEPSQVLARGFTLDQMRECIQEYEMINIWTYSTTSREIRFMSYA
jgi:hypothetical protein